MQDPNAAHRRRRGAMLPLVAITLVGLLGATALAVDGGSLQRHRRMAQNAADAAAQAGAAEIFRTHTDTATVFPAARLEAARNGYTTGTNGVNVVVTTPASPDYYTGTQYVKVVVYDTVTTFLAGALGRTKVVVSARAWGGTISPSTTCVASLETSAANALLMETGADMTATGCKVQINSTAAGAVNVGSGSVLTATSVGVTGTVTGSGTITPAALTGQAAVPDPLATIVTPSFSTTCTATNLHVTSSTVLNPGTYCSTSSSNAALWLDGGSGVVISLNPGLYVLQGGGLRISHQGLVTGTGVSFLNTNGPGNDANDLGVFNLENGANVTLSAMTTGNLAGILFYLDRNAGNATTRALVNQFQTSGSSTFTGTLYMSTQPVWFHTGANTTINGGLVAKTVRISQTGTFVNIIGTAGGSGYASLPRPSIVE